MLILNHLAISATSTKQCCSPQVLEKFELRGPRSSIRTCFVQADDPSKEANEGMMPGYEEESGREESKISHMTSEVKSLNLNKRKPGRHDIENPPQGNP